MLFGALHGLWYIVETEARRARWWKAWRKRTPDLVRASLGRMLLFALMPLTFALFRADSVETFGFLLRQLVGANAGLPWPGNGSGGAVLLAFLVIYGLPNSVEFLRRYRPGIATYANASYGPRWILRLLRWRPNWFWTAVTVAMAFVCLYFMYRHPPFLYQGF